MQVGREICRNREHALVLLALAFRKQLFVPFPKGGQVRLIVRQYFNAFALLVEQVAQSGILVADIFFHLRLSEQLHRFCRALHDPVDIHARNSHCQQAHRCQHSKTSADIIGDDEGFIALRIAHLLERAPCLVGRGKNTLCRLVPAIFLFQHLLKDTESDGRLCRRTGFGNDVYRKIPVAQNSKNIVEVCRTDVIPNEIDVRRIFFLFIIKWCLNKVQGCSRTKVGTADTNNNQNLAVCADFFRSLFNTGEFLFVVGFWQVDPANKIIALARFIVQCVVAAFHLRLQCKNFLTFCKSFAPMQGN